MSEGENHFIIWSGIAGTSSPPYLRPDHKTTRGFSHHLTLLCVIFPRFSFEILFECAFRLSKRLF